MVTKAAISSRINHGGGRSGDAYLWLHLHKKGVDLLTIIVISIYFYKSPSHLP